MISDKGLFLENQTEGGKGLLLPALERLFTGNSGIGGTSLATILGGTN